MTRDVMLSRVAGIVASLGDTGAPESMLYIICDMDMDAWQTIRGILLKANLVRISGNFVTLTKQGKETAKKVNALILSRG